MPQRALRYLLKKDRPTQAMITSFCEQIEIDLQVTSRDNRLLWGDPDTNYPYRFLIRGADQELADVFASGPDGKLVADLIELLLRKELEKKKMGSEVLGLYREINMIYDFSEKISEKIDANSIAEIALTEATQIIKCSQGLFLMYQPEGDTILSIASFGEVENQEETIAKHKALLKEWISAGTSAIIPTSSINGLQGMGHLRALMYAPLKVKHRNLGLLMLGDKRAREFTAAELKLITTIALQSASAIESAHLYEKGLREAQEREDAIRKIHEVSTKFVPFEFIRSLGKSKVTEVKLGDLVEREVTVLFADMRDFTSFSESMSPENNFLFVNAFNERMGPIVRKNKGFINQYLGDGFMALFPDGSQEAVRASVEMHKALELFNAEKISKGQKSIRMGIGMQTGKLIMGITGDVERMDAATISDTVNTAARIESLSKHYGTSILLTEDSKKKLTAADEFDFRYLGLVQVKGRKKPLKIFECINGDQEDLYQHKMETLSVFDAGMTQYYEKEFAMAAVTFQQIVKKHRGDRTAKLLLNRAALHITKEIGDDWQGVETMLLK